MDRRLLMLALGMFAMGTDNFVVAGALAGFGAARFSPTALGVASALASPEKRGRALATVTAGLTGATALGSPIGTFIGGFGTWRTTLWFVTLLGRVAMIGVWTMLPSVAQPQ